jgi:hypothetical protein
MVRVETILGEPEFSIEIMLRGIARGGFNYRDKKRALPFVSNALKDISPVDPN